MTPDRWREIERLYADALERVAEDRATFLDAACGGDNALRDEVESLLQYGTRAEDFLETSACVIDAPLAALASTVRRLNEPSVPGRFVGRTLGSYNVQALIAVGGMGEVYRGIDTRLGRTVAIKVLPGHEKRSKRVWSAGPFPGRRRSNI